MEVASESLHQVELVVTRRSEQVAGLTGTFVGMKAASAKDFEQFFALFQSRFEAMDRSSERHEAALAGLGTRVDTRFAATERDYQIEIESHAHEDAPHDSSLGKRLGKVENRMAFYAGVFGVLVFVLPIAASVLTAVFGGSS